MKIRRALFSLWNKAGAEEFALFLAENNVEIIASAGTADLLKSAGIEVTEVGDITGYGAMLGGRVKTLHPGIFAGILADRTKEEHIKAIEDAGIQPVDLVVVNFYPFEEYVSKNNRKKDDAVEMIDIGGPSMLRAAAKNHASVTPVCKQEQYATVMDEIKRNGGISIETSRRLASEAFSYTARYEAAISAFFTEDEEVGNLHDVFTLSLVKKRDLRYGENPHQAAALYGIPETNNGSLEVFQGKPLSYNNMLDVNAAMEVLADLPERAAVIIKHLNPCGCASMGNLESSFRRARKTDPLSAFGGIVGLKGTVDLSAAKAVAENFIECVVAPDYTEEAIEVFAKKKNLRVCKYDSLGKSAIEIRSVSEGILMQESDRVDMSLSDAQVVTKRMPTDEELASLEIAWIIAKHVKSNAIVFGDKEGSLGIGAGQMSRVDSGKLAAFKAGEAGLLLKGSVVASDAFFPFRDGIDVIADNGATAVVQPGGSIRDSEVIDAADEHGMAMLFTGYRHFKH